MLRAFGATDKGAIRSTNEDHYAIDERLRLLVLADGMGGHNAGEVASHVAVEVIKEFIGKHAPAMLSGNPAEADTWPFGLDPSLSDAGNLLRTAVHLANVRVLEVAGTAEEYAGMGTTVVAAIVHDGRLSVAHVGDSRLYLVSAGGVRQVTKDDSWMATMLTHDPTADPAVLQHHPMRNALTNVVGARAATEVHVVEEPLAGGELLVLTTDGVHGVLDEGAIERIADGDLDRAAAELVATALARGSRDNCTAVVARYARNGTER